MPWRLSMHLFCEVGKNKASFSLVFFKLMESLYSHRSCERYLKTLHDNFAGADLRLMKETASCLWTAPVLSGGDVVCNGDQDI